VTTPILAAQHLGGPPWPTLDPFLFCVHHVDHYPAGDEAMGPAAPLTGRRMGMDFDDSRPWKMYHGRTVPGFPRHPHRGFETITLMRKGYIDHSDSLGATARFGDGDVQWMTAGKGIEHCEMFPLVRQDADNPAELFQLWINLPSTHKMVDPHFTMLWGEDIPSWTDTDAEGRQIDLTLLAGTLGTATAPAPPPDSYASQPGSEVAILTIKLAPHATWTLPAGAAGVNRALYLIDERSAVVAGLGTEGRMLLQVRSDADVPLQAGPDGAEILMLQGRPIGEPVAQHGPFVMNTRDEIVQAYEDYRATRFGRWPHGSDDPVHPREAGRFAVHADGRREEPRA